MPHCAVIWCNNQSKNVNKKNSGVSYHKFPNNPYVKDKWIRATGKCNWCPQKHDTICSEHFEGDSFVKKRSSKTYLLFDAIPTLQLHPIFNEIDSLTNSNNIHNTASKRGKKKDPPDTTPAKRIKEGAAAPVHAPAILIKEEDSPDLALAIRIKEEDSPDQAPAILIKVEDPPVQAPAILIKEEDSPDLALAIRIKEEDSPDQAPAILIKVEDPPDQVPAIRIKEEDLPDQAAIIRIKEEDPLALIEITVEKLDEEPADESQVKREAYYTPNPQDSRQTRHLKLSLMRAQDTIKRQRLQIKRIKESNRRLTKKVDKMILCLRE